MKKYFKIVILTFAIGLIGFLSLNIVIKLKDNKNVANRIQKIPDFKLTTLSGTFFLKNDLPSQTKILFIYFNSNCDLCQVEAEEINKHIKLFRNTQIVFVSSQTNEEILDFAKKYKLLNHENVDVLCDIQDSFSDLFDVNSIPYCLIYDKNQQLIKKIEGATTVKSLLKLLD